MDEVNGVNDLSDPSGLDDVNEELISALRSGLVATPAAERPRVTQACPINAHKRHATLDQLTGASDIPLCITVSLPNGAVPRPGDGNGGFGSFAQDVSSTARP